MAWPAFAAYIMTTLAVIQIWNYTTYYINIYGRHSIRDHVFLFVNMFLLYFIGEGTQTEWQGFHTQYHIAWALILFNIALQYLIEWRHYAKSPPRSAQIRRMAGILLAEAALVAADIWVYQATGAAWFSFVAILLGMAAVVIFGQKNSADYVDFPHLTERAMLYVVFTFGEMIIGIASYFEGDFSWRSTYFALMAFLIVVGLFLSYGMLYDHIIDRERKSNGLLYMFLHIFIIFFMNNITNGLQFMQIDMIDLVPKMAFMIGSLVMYFAFLLGLGYRYTKAKGLNDKRLFAAFGAAGAVFVALMVLLRENMVLNIAVSAVFVFAMFAMLWHTEKRIGLTDADRS